jgi:hypothetical protein
MSLVPGGSPGSDRQPTYESRGLGLECLPHLLVRLFRAGQCRSEYFRGRGSTSAASTSAARNQFPVPALVPLISQTLRAESFVDPVPTVAIGSLRAETDMGLLAATIVGIGSHPDGLYLTALTTPAGWCQTKGTNYEPDFAVRNCCCGVWRFGPGRHGSGQRNRSGRPYLGP